MTGVAEQQASQGRLTFCKLRPLRTEAASTEVAAHLFYSLWHEDVFSEIVLNKKELTGATKQQQKTELKMFVSL